MESRPNIPVSLPVVHPAGAQEYLPLLTILCFGGPCAVYAEWTPRSACCYCVGDRTASWNEGRDRNCPRGPSSTIRAVGLTSQRGWAAASAPKANPEVATEPLGVDEISQRAPNPEDHQGHKSHSLRGWRETKTTIPQKPREENIFKPKK